MSESHQETLDAESTRSGRRVHAQLAELIVRKCRADDATRRGLCFLNARQFDDAIAALNEALACDADDAHLHTLLGAAAIGKGEPAKAVEHFAIEGESDKNANVRAIRAAHALWAADQAEDAVTTLRRAIRRDPDDAELHFQLGTFLASQNQIEEAELRLTQAVSINGEHFDALVSLALTCGVRQESAQAVALLRRAQTLRPDDARVAMILARAVRAVAPEGDVGFGISVVDGASRALPDRWIEALSGIIESDPDFVDAFLSLPSEKTNAQVYENLLRSLERALARLPEHGELHYHCGRVLDRLERVEEAIAQTERAAQIDPRSIRALVELGKLYQKTDRKADAASRLEQAVRAGGDYADVHFLLGNLYRDQGRILKAKAEYRNALTLNRGYDRARRALSALSE